MGLKRIPVSYSINNYLETDDSRFVAITIDVLHTGLNYNGSIFDKDVVDMCADSIKNTPVLGFIDITGQEPDFKGHEYKTIETNEGKKYVYAGSAYGVVPESCDYRWISKVSSDGVLREYFQVDALLWSKFDDAVSIFNGSGGKPQSMELEIDSIEGEELDDGTFRFTGFRFDGCCLLSSTDESIEPAMIDSIALPTFSVEGIAKEIKDRLNQYQSISEPQEVKDMPNETKDFTLTVTEQIEEIQNLFAEQEKFTDEWGYVSQKYVFLDIQDSEIIAYNREDHFRVYGIPFSIDEDVITIDYDSAKRKKVSYMDLEENDGEETVFSLESPVIEVAEFINGQIEEKDAKLTQITDMYTDMKSEFEEMKPKYDAYVLEAQEREEKAVAEAKEKEFARFDKFLADEQEYVELKENAKDYTLEEIQRKCAVMYVDKTIEADFTKKEKTEPITANVIEEKPTAEINPRYGVMDYK